MHKTQVEFRPHFSGKKLRSMGREIRYLQLQGREFQAKNKCALYLQTRVESVVVTIQHASLSKAATTTLHMVIPRWCEFQLAHQILTLDSMATRRQ